MRVIADELDRKEAELEALQGNESANNVDMELQVIFVSWRKRGGTKQQEA